jgi:hypothetical protein
MVAVAVCGLAPAATLAAKLDNAACAALTDERNAITATGVKADMERGPEWAKANMPPERLQSALRLLEVEDQLEFRCGRRGKPAKAEQTAAPGMPPTPATGTPAVAVKNSAQDNAQDSTKPEEQPPSRVVPVAPADQKSTSASPTLAPAVQPPVAFNPTLVVPAPPPQRTSTAGPGAAPPSPLVNPVNAPAGGSAAVAPAGPAAPATSAVNIPTQPAPVVAGTPPVTEANQQAVAVPIGPTPGGPALPGVAPAGKSPQAAARKKRRDPSSAYVAPGEVNPFSLPGMR